MLDYNNPVILLNHNPKASLWQIKWEKLILTEKWKKFFKTKTKTKIF